LTKAEKLLERWSQRVPSDGVPCEDAVLVMESLSMTVTTDSQNHKYARHPKLIGSSSYPTGGFRVNCHYKGKQGVAHPAAVRDIVKAAKIIQTEE
jgi:hypothetical protein